MQCRLCECPTADGAVRASQVDQIKLRNWALKALKSNGCEVEFNEVVQDDDLICYFCIWQCEFVARYEFTDESLIWWPKELRLDAAAKQLRKNFLKGKVDQCWVQLEKIPLPEADFEDSKESAVEARLSTEPQIKSIIQQCVYCRRFYKGLKQHIQRNHKDKIIRRDYPFPKHNLGQPSEFKDESATGEPKVKCRLCKNDYNCASIRRHMKQKHGDHKFVCSFRGCRFYSKTNAELLKHYEVIHENKAKPHKCPHCSYCAERATALKQHMGRLHLPKNLECYICKQKFATVVILNKHIRLNHFGKKEHCSACKRSMRPKNFRTHAQVRKCTICKSIVACAGLYKSHFSKCTSKKNSESFVQCERCERTYKWKWDLLKHVEICYRWTGLDYEHLGLKCFTCRAYFESVLQLRKHMQVHQAEDATILFCAHCPRKFNRAKDLVVHLANGHDQIKIAGLREHMIDFLARRDCDANRYHVSFTRVRHKKQLAKSRNKSSLRSDQFSKAFVI